MSAVATTNGNEAKAKMTKFVSILSFSDTAIVGGRIHCSGPKVTQYTGLYTIGREGDSARMYGGRGELQLGKLPESLQQVIKNLRSMNHRLMSIELDERCGQTTSLTPLFAGSITDEIKRDVMSALRVCVSV